MLRSILICAIVACAAAATTSGGLGCQSISISPASTSICKSASGSICTTAAAASLTQTAATALWNTYTSTFVTAAGTAACTAIGGTVNTGFWTNPTLWGCDGTNPNPCNSATCGVTGGATAAPVTVLPYCCASIRTAIGNACSGVANLATLITPTSSGNGTTLILSALGLSGSCADTGCKDYTVGASSATTYSVLVLLLAALLAVFNL